VYVTENLKKNKQIGAGGKVEREKKKREEKEILKLSKFSNLFSISASQRISLND